MLRVATPNDVAARAVSLSLGSAHGCGLDEVGGVKCWGDASHGQLGVGVPREAFQVQTIIGLPTLIEVASTLFYSCGRTREGRVWCWGANEQGQVGSDEPGPGPRQVAGITNANAIQLAANRACARLAGGQVICWGDSLDCGNDRSQSPALAPDLENALQFVRAASECFWCVLRSDHRLTCDGDPIAIVRFTMESVSSVAAGIYHACATRFDGSVWCWGGNPTASLAGSQPVQKA